MLMINKGKKLTVHKNEKDCYIYTHQLKNPRVVFQQSSAALLKLAEGDLKLCQVRGKPLLDL